jgi:Ca2+/Na+ antiporter
LASFAYLCTSLAYLCASSDYLCASLAYLCASSAYLCASLAYLEEEFKVRQTPATGLGLAVFCNMKSIK